MLKLPKFNVLTLALIPPFFLDCVIAIGVIKPNRQKDWVGTGFLVGRSFTRNDSKTKSYHLFMVTNKQVFNKLLAEHHDQAIFRFNSKEAGAPAKDYLFKLIDENGQKKFTEHPNQDIDVAVTLLDAKILQKDNIRFGIFKDDEHLLNISQLSENGVAAGDLIYVLSYPMGIVDPKRPYPIARLGSIARIREALAGRSKNFLVDAFVFPGNSG